MECRRIVSAPAMERRSGTDGLLTCIVRWWNIIESEAAAHAPGSLAQWKRAVGPTSSPAPCAVRPEGTSARRHNPSYAQRGWSPRQRGHPAEG
jgi:hypothetical protein